MSKRLTIELLKKKIYAMPEKERKPYLIRCLDRQGLIIKEISVLPIPKVEHDICKVCQSSSIIRSNHELICQQCGATQMSVSSNRPEDVLYVTIFGFWSSSGKEPNNSPLALISPEAVILVKEAVPNVSI